MHASLGDFTFAAGLLALGAFLVQRLNLPPLPAYLLTGLLAGSRLDVEALEPLPSLGLLLLLFSVGLEFGPERLGELSKRGLRAGFIDALALPLGAGLGLLVGLDLRGALLLGGVLYVSSSAVVVKLIIDLRRAANPESEVALAVLVVEDLVIAVLLAFIGGHAGLSPLLASVGLVALYLLAARLLAPRLARWLDDLSDELVLLAGAAFTVGTALLFHEVGASEGIGAFVAGVVATGLGLRERLERLFGPVRDLAVALFFLTVGAQALGLLEGITWLVLALVLVGLLYKLPLGYVAGKQAGLNRRHSLLTALYLVPRGEFNLLLGTLALSAGYPLVSQVAVLLVLVSIPLGALLLRYGPELTRRRRAGVRPDGVALDR